jgi:LytTr DNA-binding domain
MGKRIAIEIMLMLALGFALGLIGPFGTYAMATVPRLTYWIVFGLAGYAIFRPFIVAGDWLRETLNIPRFVGIGIALLIAALPMTLLVATLLLRHDLAVVLQWQGLGLLYLQVWLIGFLTNGLFQLIFGKVAFKPETAPKSAQSAQETTTEPAFLSRLPAGFGPLLALRGEDHYVRAIGEQREELLLMRLSDAVAELAGADGITVHRSWWVNRPALRSQRRDGRALTLILTNGCEVPVARSAIPMLKKAGWLE